MNDVTVYDLGSVDTAADDARSGIASEPRPGATPRARQRTAFRPAPAPPRPAVDLAASVNLFLPGTERLVRGEAAAGLGIMSTLGLAAALGWAIFETLGRLAATFELFGISRGAGLWSLAGVYALAAVTHTVAILLADPIATRAPHPVAAGVASFVVPGWGQILNGDRVRAATLIVAVWALGALWLLSTPASATLIERFDLFLPPPLAVASSAAARWTATAVLWAIAIYDATQRASFRRSQEG